jgi:hypothetical protein
MNSDEATKLLTEYTYEVVSSTHRCKTSKKETALLKRLYRSLTGSVLDDAGVAAIQGGA